MQTQSGIRALLHSRLHISGNSRGRSHCAGMYRLQFIRSPFRLLRLKGKKISSSSRNCLSSFFDYSALGAPTGHTPAQAPHSTQASASITYLPSPSEIAPTGHSAAQAPQLTQSSEIIYAIFHTPPCYSGACAPRIFILTYLSKKSILFC